MFWETPNELLVTGFRLDAGFVPQGARSYTPLPTDFLAFGPLVNERPLERLLPGDRLGSRTRVLGVRRDVRVQRPRNRRSLQPAYNREYYLGPTSPSPAHHQAASVRRTVLADLMSSRRRDRFRQRPRGRAAQSHLGGTFDLFGRLNGPVFASQSLRVAGGHLFTARLTQARSSIPSTSPPSFARSSVHRLTRNTALYLEPISARTPVCLPILFSTS